MEQVIPSSSAEGAALLRAVESMKPENERVCYDPYAKDFLGSKKAFWLSQNDLLRRFILDNERKTPGAFGCVVGRTRYIDDYLKACINAGIEQLVILGAGYDSRAYRFRELKGRVRVFELDKQATQKVKKEKVAGIFGSLPDNIVYVSIDFEKDGLDKKLFESGYDRGLKTLFIWEGVTMYLTAEAVSDTLAFMATNSGEGSFIIFNYIRGSIQNGTSEFEYVKLRKAHEAEESFRFAIEDEAIEVFLSGRGLAGVKSVTGEFFKRTYFDGVNRNRKVCSLCGFATATVHQLTIR